MLESTDRQYGDIEHIRRDHVQRYIFAAQRLSGVGSVLDLACGCGYGSWLLQASGAKVTGVDISHEAIAYAEKYYPGPTYCRQAAEETTGTYEALVSFETLEHLDRPEVVLAIQAPVIIASVPNEERYPFSPEVFASDKYPHKRHYTPKEFEDLLNSCGFEVTEKFCQPTKQGDIQAGTDGLFLIYCGSRLP